MRFTTFLATLFSLAVLPSSLVSANQAPVGSILASRTVHPSPFCKPLPGDAHWPSSSSWSRLNTSINGHLLAPSPPAAVCYDPARPPPAAANATAAANSTACKIVTDAWFNSSFHSDDPASVDWPNWEGDACVPPALYGSVGNVTARPECRTAQFPRFVVNATSAEDVATAVTFAGKTGVRLIVKATGHDMLGRSTAPNALSIWTHHIRNLTYHPSFSPKSCPKVAAHSAVTVAAGHQWGEIYDFVAKQNQTLVGGADPNVGVGGWLTGGGHSPLSAKYGLGVDNTLEMVVVTPEGKTVVANECQHADLFWAMRGGGGSTFGVLISATFKTYPDLPLSGYAITINSTAAEAAAPHNNTHFFDAAALLTAQLPTFSAAGLMGYYFIYPLAAVSSSPYASGTTKDSGSASSPASDNSKAPMGIGIIFWAIDTPYTHLDPVVTPFVEKAKAIAPPDLLTVSSQPIPLPSFAEARRLIFTAGSVGVNALIASRLWDAAAVTNPASKEAIRAVASVGGGFQGLFVSGPGVRGVGPTAAAVTPAWRTAIVHALGSTGWEFGGDATTAAARDTEQMQKPLTSLAPGSGAYLNEADPFQEGWREAFWGSNYERLVRIKRAVDPKGVFWCSVCVGAEFWKEDKASGRICKA